MNTKRFLPWRNSKLGGWSPCRVRKWLLFITIGRHHLGSVVLEEETCLSSGLST